MPAAGKPQPYLQKVLPSKGKVLSSGPSLHTSIWVAQLSDSGIKNLEEDMCTWLMVSEVPRLLGSVISGIHGGTAPWCARANQKRKPGWRWGREQTSFKDT